MGGAFGAVNHFTSNGMRVAKAVSGFNKAEANYNQAVAAFQNTALTIKGGSISTARTAARLRLGK